MTRRLPRPLLAAALLGLALLLALPLVYGQFQSTPFDLNAAEGAATIHFSADRDRVLFPGECVVVRWLVEGIRAVYVNDLGVIGQGERELCLANAQPNLHVEFGDDTSGSYTLPVDLVYRDPLALALLVGALLALAAAAYCLWGAPALLVVLVVAIFAPMLRVQLNLGSDYLAHTQFALGGLEDYRNLPPHFLYHVAVAGLHTLFPALNLEQGGFLLLLAAYIATGLMAYAVLRWVIDVQAGERRLSLLCAGLALALLLVGPISVFSDRFNPAERSSLIYPNVYHNPTALLLNPLALGLFFVLMRLLARPRSNAESVRFALSLAALTVLCTLAKPNFTFALVPALCLLIAVNFVRPFRLNWKTLIVGVLLPAVLVLGWQYLFTYGPDRQSRINAAQSQLVFAPFRFFLDAWHVPWVWLMPELLLSIAFPLAVYLLYSKPSRAQPALNLAWLTFFAGVSFAYLFVEEPGASSGNVIWGAQVSLLILFVVSAAYGLRFNLPVLRGETRLNWRFGLCAALFAAHLVNHLLVLLN